MSVMTTELTEPTELKDSGHTILVVDDVSDNIILISLWLQDTGYRVVTANNGDDALTIAKLARPDLILMDIAMPQQDGLAATRRIRRRDRASGRARHRAHGLRHGRLPQAAFDAGFNGYLTKPIDFERCGS